MFTLITPDAGYSNPVEYMFAHFLDRVRVICADFEGTPCVYDVTIDDGNMDMAWAQELPRGKLHRANALTWDGWQLVLQGDIPTELTDRQHAVMQVLCHALDFLTKRDITALVQYGQSSVFSAIQELVQAKFVTHQTVFPHNNLHRAQGYTPTDLGRRAFAHSVRTKSGRDRGK